MTTDDLARKTALRIALEIGYDTGIHRTSGPDNGTGLFGGLGVAVLAYPYDTQGGYLVALDVSVADLADRLKKSGYDTSEIPQLIANLDGARFGADVALYTRSERTWGGLLVLEVESADIDWDDGDPLGPDNEAGPPSTASDIDEQLYGSFCQLYDYR